MKKLYVFLLLLLTGIILFAGEVKVTLRPEQVEIDPYSRTGSGQLVISADDEIRFSDSYPKVNNLTWQHGTFQQSSMQIINGKMTRSYSIAMPFTVRKEGEYTIPSLTVTCDGKEVKTKPVTFTVVRQKVEKITEKNGTDAEPVFAKLSLGKDVKKLYAGEEVPVIFSVYTISDLAEAAIWQSMIPSYSSGDGVKTVFHDFTEGNPRTLNVEKTGKGQAEINGKKYDVWQFQTRFRPLSAGTLTLSARCDAKFNVGSFFFDDVRSKQLTAAMPDVTVLPLPSMPENMPSFCGLVGAWNIQVTGWDKDTVKTGDPLTLKLQIKGTGAADAFHAPDWQPEGFRIYPPELSQADQNTLIVSYTVIPVREGKTELDFSLSTFDTKTEKYIPFSWKTTLTVRKADPLVKTQQITVDAGPAVKEDNKQAIPEGYITPDVPYAKKDIQSGRVRLPLWKNAVTVSGWLLVSGFFILVFCLAVYVHNVTGDNTPEGVRKHTARKRKKELLKKLSSAEPAELGQYAGEISEYVNDILALPPGTGLAEASDNMEGGATVPLAKALKVLSEEAWMPGASAKSMTPGLKNDLIRGIKKFLVLTILLFPVSGIFAEDEALAAYDKGDFQKALELYKKELQKDCRQVSPALLYNMGNCYDQTGNPAMAYVCYERATRLAPRDSAIRERRDAVRRKLQLPVTSEINHPKDILPHVRDLMRPDEWLTGCAAGVFLCLTGFGICLLRRKKAGLYVLAAGCAVAVAAFVLFMWQTAQLYSGRDAVVVQMLSVRSLPSEQSGKVEFTLREGKLVHIEEIRSGWARIPSGWVPVKGILPLWNGDMHDLL